MLARRKVALAAALLIGTSPVALAGRTALPPDFDLPPITYGGAGGGISMTEKSALTHFPVVMVPDVGRAHDDWLGANPGNTVPGDSPSVYDHLLQASFRPIELWMIDFSRAGDQMSSIEEATDDLKFFVAEVLRYTGADRVQILAHGKGCLLARLTLLKYNIGHWVESEVYIAGPFHGVSPAPDSGRALLGHPNDWVATQGSALLQEILGFGESPLFRRPPNPMPWSPRTMTIRNGQPGGDQNFSRNPDSPALLGATNIRRPWLDHDGLRCSPDSAEAFVPFLSAPARPYRVEQDGDRDGFRGADFGGPDCNDTDPSIYPCAAEIRGDGVDQDCNGCDYSKQGGRDGEILLDSSVNGTKKKGKRLRPGKKHGR